MMWNARRGIQLVNAINGAQHVGRDRTALVPSARPTQWLVEAQPAAARRTAAVGQRQHRIAGGGVGPRRSRLHYSLMIVVVERHKSPRGDRVADVHVRPPLARAMPSATYSDGVSAEDASSTRGSCRRGPAPEASRCSSDGTPYSRLYEPSGPRPSRAARSPSAIRNDTAISSGSPRAHRGPTMVAAKVLT